MVKFQTFIGVGLASIVFAGFVVQPVLAQSPKLIVAKRVQNVTTNSVMADANNADEAIAVKPGDILRYEIKVKTEGGELQKVKLSDALPEGIELVGDTKKRAIDEDLGTVTDKEITKEYKVKVTSTQDAAVLDNKVSVTPEGGAATWDTAKAKVSVTKKATPAPTPTPAPTTPKSSTGKTEPLPQSGPGEALAIIVGTSVVGYAVHMYLRSRRDLISTLFTKTK